MANCSIPNSSPASGLISTRSLRRSRRQNSQPLACTSVSRGCWLDVRKRRQVHVVESVRWRTAALQSAFQALKIRRRTLNSLPRFSFYGVERLLAIYRSWEFSAIRRVKGAWWPSRSSKPSSLRKWRGRFDSYPLRLFICDSRLPIADCFGARRMISIANRNSKIENRVNGGEPHVA
jgi:hypothetical protein